MQNYTFYHQTRRLTLFIMICVDIFTTGPSCSKHRLFNELVNRSTRYVFYDFVIKYTDTFCRKNERSFCTAKASHIFSTKNTGVYEICFFEILTKR